MLNVDLVSTGRTLWSGIAQMVIAPSVDGEIGILTGHTPILAALRPGSVRIKMDGADPVHVDVTGGFMSVDNNLVTVVVDGVASGSEG